jgi:Protein of unknown function (DUF4232)
VGVRGRRSRARVGWALGVSVLAACAGSSGRSASTTTTASVARSSTSGPAAPRPACQTGQLQVSLVGPDAGAGQRYVTLVLTNAGGTCQTVGYVGLQLLGPGGVAIPTDVARVAGPVASVTLPPGGQASTPLHWAGIPLSDEAQTGPCEPMPAQVEVTPPNQTQFLTAAWSFDPVCGHGHIDVQPLVAGVPSPP